MAQNVNHFKTVKHSISYLLISDKRSHGTAKFRNFAKIYIEKRVTFNYYHASKIPDFRPNEQHLLEIPMFEISQYVRHSCKEL